MPPETAKWIIVAMLTLVVITLFTGFRYMLKGGDSSPKLAKALGWRVAFSIVTVAFIVLAGSMGWLDRP